MLHKGGKAGFTVWGRQQNAASFTFVSDVAKEFGRDFKIRDYGFFHLNDKEMLVAEVKKAGFASVKAFYSPMNLTQSTEEFVGM